MKTFTAIDFETTQPSRHTICQVGLVRVENGVVKEKFSQLVQPPDNYYWRNFTDIHGIDASKTRTAPHFNRVWPAIQKHISGQIVVAHNAAFDISCLTKTLEYYSLKVPAFQKYCTYQIYKDNLKSLCTKHKIELNHHDALSDAMACAQLFLMHSLKK